MAGFTNRGKLLMLQGYFAGSGIPSNFYMALCTSGVTPTDTTNTLSDLFEVATGNGYTAGGMSLNRNTTDFSTLTEDDANHRASVILRDLVWTAAGGNLPSSSGARWAVLTTSGSSNVTRHIIAYFDLLGDRVVSDTQTLTTQGCEFRCTET